MDQGSAKQITAITRMSISDMLREGQSPAAIEKTLVNRGYNREGIRKVIAEVFRQHAHDAQLEAEAPKRGYWAGVRWRVFSKILSKILTGR